MDTYRINRYDIANQSSYTNRLLQGGLRYQKLNLSSAGQLGLSGVGLKPSLSHTSHATIPGSFSCSDHVLNNIWNTSARTIQLNELPAHSVPNFWVITDQGAFVDSLAPQPFAADYAAMLTSYDLGSSVKPISNGFGFTVLSDTLGKGVYIFVNVANSSISAHAGSTEPDTPLASGPLPPSIKLNEWHTVYSVVNATHISVQIDGFSVLQFSQTSSSFGSFGLGASWDRSAFFTNVSLNSSGNQTYFSSFTNKTALEDFLLGTNPLPVSVDGSRRDRTAYAGDLDIASCSAFASTGGLQYIKGSIALLGSSQMAPGFFVPTAKVQQAPRTSEPQENITGLIGYSFSLISAMARYYEQTGDTEFLDHWIPNAIRMLDWAHSQTLSNGLFNISDPTMGGDWNYYDPSLSGVVSKFNLIYAYSLKQWLPLLANTAWNKTVYTQRLQHLQNAINENLWSNDLQAYYLSDSYKDTISQEANAFAILSGTADSHGATSSILSTLARELYVPSGALSFSNASAKHGWTRNISPYASGYHLKAAFHANDSATARYLLHTVWGPMSDPKHTNYTGCMWETLDIDGNPGLGDSTSLCHAWSSGPTADLSRYVLGIQPLSPGFGEWKVQPQTLDLDWAKGEYPIPQGKITVHWWFDGDQLLHMNVTAPEETNGTVYLPNPLRKPLHKYNVFGNDLEDNSSFLVRSGRFTFDQLD